MNYLFKQFTLLPIFLCFGSWIYAGAVIKTPDDPEFFREHLNKRSYEIDTSASAVVLFEKYVYNMSSKGGCTVRRVIKIMKKEGLHYGDVNVSIANSKYWMGSIAEIKGATYSLIDGDIEKVEMLPQAIKIEKANDFVTIGKFSLPAVEVGSIIDYTYETKEAYFSSTINWHISEAIPKLWSQVTVLHHDYSTVTMLTQRTPDFREYDDKIDLPADSILPEAYYIPVINNNPGYQLRRWVRRNIPATVVEPYTFGAVNSAELMDIDLGNAFFLWKDLNKSIKQDNYVLGPLVNPDNIKIVQKYLRKIGEMPTDSLELAKNIYRHIRDSFTLVNESNMMTIRDLDWTIKNRHGNHLDLQLALISLLRASGLRCYPVLVSTRESVKLLDGKALYDRVDNIITRIKIGGIIYHLDPAEKNASFGIVSPSNYHGFSWVVSDTGYSEYLNPWDIREKQVIQVYTISDNVSGYTIGIKKTFGNYTAVSYRDKWQKDTMEVKKAILDDLKQVSLDPKLVSYEVQNLYNPDTSLSIQYSVKINWPSTNEVFFAPSMLNYFVSNPFKSITRVNPVEMPYGVDVTYSLNLTLPQQYKLENLPESQIFKLDEWDNYKYQIEYTPETRSIMMNSRLSMHKTYFDPEVYPDLRLFFEKIIEKQQANLVLKKVN